MTDEELLQEEARDRKRRSMANVQAVGSALGCLVQFAIALGCVYVLLELVRWWVQ